MKKYIFILDLDSTIIGNCSYQSKMFEYGITLKKYNKNININKILSPYYDTNKSLLIRPYFIYFINKMKEIYKDNVLFYIYTASSTDWANFQIKLIEKNNNIKFNRPIFTRKNCLYDNINNNFVKKIEPILNKIKSKSTDYDIIIIDDNDVYLDYTNTHIKCKPYNFISYCDFEPVLNNLPQHMQSDLLNAFKCPVNNIDACNIKNKIKIYKWLYNKCKFIYNKNKIYENDMFWLYLTNIIDANKITDFNDNIIKQLTILSNKF